MSKDKPSTGAIRQRNQQLILQAAELEFASHGFRGTSLQAIAERAGLPKANILYYFNSKAGLYRALLEDILAMWNRAFDSISADDEPAVALAGYIRGKLHYSRAFPQRSRIFAMEIIQGAPNLTEPLQQPMVQWTRDKASVIQAWIDQGKMRAVDPFHLMYLIWGGTQFYADFAPEIRLIHGQPLSDEQYRAAEDTLVGVILRGVGL